MMMCSEEFFSDDQEEDYDMSDQEYYSDSVEVDLRESDWDDGSSNNVMEFNVLGGNDIRLRVENDILEISRVLPVSRGAAVAMLSKFGWNVSRIHEEWFSDEEKIRRDFGLEDSGTERKHEGEFFCGICLEEYDRDEVDHRAVMGPCGDVFCETCWKTYIGMSVNDDGPGCLSLRCPQPSCGALIGDLIDLFASDEEERTKYENYVGRSYVEGRKNIKWCPAPGCDFAVECLVKQSSSSCEVACSCSYEFCWNCSEEAHSPADCEIVAKWVEKNTSESENTNWILANTKPCPKCQKRIQKNQGCMHMSCRAPCDFQFCWLCLGPWSEHGQETGGFYRCNQFEAAKSSGEFKEAEQVREMAKNSLVKYTHYFERWVGNHNSRKRALENIQEFRTQHLEELSNMYIMTMTQLQIITDAWFQIAECRRVLKWSYTYGYYLPEDEPLKKKFFEYTQGQAESHLERLHNLVEIELSKYRNQQYPASEFKAFCANVVDLTTITRNYFDNLVRALENGLSDVN